MENQVARSKRKTLSISEYASELSRSGTRVLPGTQGAFWTKYESGAMVRIPTFHFAPPASGEVRQVLRRARAAVVSYLLAPNRRDVANAWLYVCTDRAYGLSKLAPAMRRNVSRGLKELKIAPVASDQLLVHGVQAFCDTRGRVGLSDGTPAEFRRRFMSRAQCPSHVFIGAWKDETLAAFLSITEVEDWAEIEGCFSMNSFLHLRPNDTLFFYALSNYLVEGGCYIVSYGLSSIQAESNEEGLHAFKRKVGFQAQPVHRAFVLHPLLRPFANHLTLWGVNMALRCRPGERRLKKLGGILACILGERSMPEVSAESKSDDRAAAS